MIKLPLPLTMSAADKIFLLHVVRQRNSWRDVALGNVREIKRLREWFTFMVGRNESHHAYIRTLQRMLIDKVAEYNRVGAKLTKCEHLNKLQNEAIGKLREERDHYNSLLRHGVLGPRNGR